jgi:hypothetical protein
VSIAYITTHVLTFGFFVPLQQIFVPEISDKISLAFLPHGVRVLAFYYFGWRALLYLLPSSYLMWFIASYGLDISFDILSPIISLIACYVGVKITSRLETTTSDKFDRSTWQYLILAGAAASILNGIGLSILQHDSPYAVATFTYLIGDVSGLIITLLLAMYIFRLVRLIPK